MQFKLLFPLILALASASPTPQNDCWTTCSTSCIQAGNIRGGICNGNTCTCLTGFSVRGPEPEPQLSPAAQCWSTCSTGCVQGGNIRGGLCDAAGTCTCLVGARDLGERQLSPEDQCWSTCSTDCLAGGQVQGGLCDAAGTCTCL